MSAIRLSAVALLCALASTAVSAAPASATSRPIVYLIVVDGLDGDRYDAGNMPFLKSLGGTYYKESRSIMVAETNPNHTAMITGAYGNRSGIPGNEFALYAPLENGDSCKATGPQDISKAPTVTSGENHNCVLAQTLFAAAKRQVPGRYVTAFATGKPKLGRLFSGRTVDPAKTDADVIFSPCGSDATEEDEAYCSKVPLNPISGYALDDGTVMDAVLAQMYQGPNATRPDFSFVNLHQVDSAGHATGTGAAYEQTVRDADAQIKRLVDTLKARKEWDRTVMIVVSDHSMDTTLTKVTLTSRLESAGVPSDAFTVVENGSVDMIYLHDRTSPDRFALLAKMRAVVLAGSGVEEALYREDNPADGGAAHTVATVHPAWHVDGERHGDLFVTSKPGTSFSDPSGFSNPIPGNHGGPQTRDNLFVVTGGSPAVKDQEVGGTAAPFFDDTLINEGSAENVDSATTVAGLLGLDPPAQNDGRFLSEAFDLARLPGRGGPEQLPKLRISRPKRGVLRIRTFRVRQREADVTVKDLRTKRIRRVKRAVALREVLFKGRPGRRYEVRVRTTSPITGGRSAFVKKRITVRSR